MSRITFLALVLCPAIAGAETVTFTFDDDRFEQEFTQSGVSENDRYVQADGTLLAYPGSNYNATATYSKPFRMANSSATLSMDLFYDNELYLSGRMFRLSVGADGGSVYLSGMYVAGLDKMWLVAAAAYGGTTHVNVGEITLENGHWYRVNASFTHTDARWINMQGTFTRLEDGEQLRAWDKTFANAPVSQATEAYASFKALKEGGITRVDNIAITTVPEPVSCVMLLAGTATLLLLRRRGWRYPSRISQKNREGNL